MAGTDENKKESVSSITSIAGIGLMRLVRRVTALLCALFITDMVSYWSKY
jgi:hypothetical protein